jgi:hypothetical protein
MPTSRRSIGRLPMSEISSLFPALPCKVLGHSWRLLRERWVNTNRHDMGGTREWYCVRCLTNKTTRF